MRSIHWFALATLTLATLSSQRAEAQRRLTGRITEEGSGAPVPSATVQVVGGTAGALTSNAGTYTINVPAGSIHAPRSPHRIPRAGTVHHCQPDHR